MSRSGASAYGKSAITWLFASGLFAALITIAWPYIMDRPNMYIKVVRHEDESLSKSKIVIYNTGGGSAMNLRVTINPEYNMTEYKTEFYTEEVTLVDTGPRSLIAKLPRLAPGAQVQIAVILNSTDSSPSFRIWANHDTGSTTDRYETQLVTRESLEQIMTVLYVVAYGMLAAIAILTVYPFVYRWRRHGSPWPKRRSAEA